MIKQQKGINLVSVIFLLVVISAIGLFMLTLGNVQQQTSTYSVLSSRAVYAAQSGMQWAIRSVLTTNDCSAFTGDFNLTGTVSSNFTISPSCTFSMHTENPLTYNVYQLSVTARNGSVGDDDYISRTITAKVTDLP
ncbi:MAG: hypothetical protein GKR93_16850 [Gammaproteobacteria bacterium]|nr:hypothetical protein [Gammaproteobacteria bacterium]